MPRCRACYSLFETDEGVLAHMRRSLDQRCRAMLDEYLLTAIRAHSSSPPPDFAPEDEHLDVPHDSDDPPFEGDYFGDDYGRGDLPGLDGSEDLDITLEMDGGDAGSDWGAEQSGGGLEYEEEEEEEGEEEEYLWYVPQFS